MEGSQHLCQVGNEPVVEVDAPQELLQLLLGRRACHADDGLDLGRQGNDARFGDGLSEKLDGVGAEHTLLLVDGETSALKDAKMCSRWVALSSGVALATRISSK